MAGKKYFNRQKTEIEGVLYVLLVTVLLGILFVVVMQNWGVLGCGW